ncbi:hypothetical protein [Limosilactobacillus fermentum]
MSIIYPNDPSDPTKIADSSVPDYPVIAFIPGYTPEDHMRLLRVPVDPDDRTKGYIPPTPSDNGTDTTITYTADQQKGSVSYVDDTTGKALGDGLQSQEQRVHNPAIVPAVALPIIRNKGMKSDHSIGLFQHI